MTQQEIDQYWEDFDKTADELIAEWREQYDPDGELGLVELIAVANKEKN